MKVGIQEDLDQGDTALIIVTNEKKMRRMQVKMFEGKKHQICSACGKMRQTSNEEDWQK